MRVTRGWPNDDDGIAYELVDVTSILEDDFYHHVEVPWGWKVMVTVRAGVRVRVRV